MPLVLGSESPKAVKEHRCECCGRVIAPGERYNRQRIIGDDGPYVWKACAHCLALFRLIDLYYDDTIGWSGEDFLEHEPATVTEARWLAYFRRRWTRDDGSLFPVPGNGGGDVMSPALRGENIPRGVGPLIQRTEAGAGEVRLTCERLGCDWSAVRPEHAAPSAAEAHRIAHAKGMVP